MTPNHQELDDRALDTMVESIAHADAPAGLAARVAAAIDARDSSPFVGRRLVFGMAAVAAGIVVLAGALWMTARHSATPAPAIVAHDTPATAPNVSPAPGGANSAAPSEQLRPVATPPRVADSREGRRSLPADHDRALPALNALTPVIQPDITPPSLETTSIGIEPMNAIAPLTVESGRDTSGRGDFR